MKESMKLSINYRSILRNKKWILFLLPSFSGVVYFVILPFLDVVKRSFHTAVAGEWNGLENYKLVFYNKAFRLASLNTIKFALFCLPLLIVLGLITALLLQGLKRQEIIKSCLLFPMAIPVASVVLVWKMVFHEQGFLNLILTYFKNTNIHIDFMRSEASFYVLVFSYIWKNLGYTVILWLTGLNAIPKSMKEAAQMDGAGRIKIFRYIVIPNLKGSLYTITVLSFLNSFKVFREAYLTAGAYPDESMYLLQHLFNNWYRDMQFDKMSAAAVVMAAVLIIFIMLLQRFWDEKDSC